MFRRPNKPVLPRSSFHASILDLAPEHVLDPYRTTMYRP